MKKLQEKREHYNYLLLSIFGQFASILFIVISGELGWRVWGICAFICMCLGYSIALISLQEGKE